MEEKINSLLSETENKIDAVDDRRELMDIKVSVLGKSGKFAELMRELKNIPAELKPAFGNWSTTRARRWKNISATNWSKFAAKNCKNVLPRKR